MTLRAKMALARFHVFHAVIEEHLALARNEEHDFAVGLVLVVTDGSALLERPVHNARRPVKVHLRLVFLLATLEVRQHRRFHAFQIDNHRNLVFQKTEGVMKNSIFWRRPRAGTKAFSGHKNQSLLFRNSNIFL